MPCGYREGRTGEAEAMTLPKPKKIACVVVILALYAVYFWGLITHHWYIN